MMTWRQLKAFDLQVLTQPLPRDPDVHQAYETSRGDPTFQPKLVSMLRQGLAERAGIWLRVNDFPYQTPEGVKHYVLWFTDTKTINSLHTARMWVMAQLGLTEDQVVMCCNDIALKTVPEVCHYHVFIRLRDSASE